MPRRAPEFNPEPGVVTVYSDIACPWSGLALHGLRRARHRLGLSRVRFDLRAFPLELHDERPTPKRIRDAETVVVGGLEPTLEWRVWQAPDHEWPVSTLLALEAVQAAKRPEVGGLTASDELDEALRGAWYRESRCVSILPVITAVAETCEHVDVAALSKAMLLGAGRAEVITQWRNSGQGAVPGTPHVFLANGDEWHNPGFAVRWTGEPGVGFPTVLSYDPTVYDEIVQAAAGR